MLKFIAFNIQGKPLKEFALSGILQRKRLRLREGKQFAQCHTAEQ